MNRGARTNDIHAWWEGMSEERYWLDVTDREGRDRLLAAPIGSGRIPTDWTHRLITHVRGGDVVFHYDRLQQAIVAWSLAHGRVVRKDLLWPAPAEVPGEPASQQRLPSWSISLRQPTELGAAVPLAEIARFQWSLYPALRDLEDEVGDPLYYPFEMGSREATRPLPGYVFKLPAVFVEGVSELARAAHHVARLAGARPAASIPMGAPAPPPYAVSR